MNMIRGENTNSIILVIDMKNIKFITTFSDNGYYVYGKSWIKSFLEKTKSQEHITAEIYVNNLDTTQFNYGNKIKVFNYDNEIPERNLWEHSFLNTSNHGEWNKNLGVKFSFKSFVMLHCLKKYNEEYIIWLDADCVFTSDNFENWPNNLLNNHFIACQREQGSEHVETGIIIFDSNHTDKQKYIEKFESFYMNADEYNNFGQFFDGFVVGRTLNHTQINHVNLNENFGLSGIQSDPKNTFLNPEIKNRFIHNIGITGKRKYDEWNNYKHDKFFQLIHGINDKPLEEQLQENLSAISSRLNDILR